MKKNTCHWCVHVRIHACIAGGPTASKLCERLGWAMPAADGDQPSPHHYYRQPTPLLQAHGDQPSIFGSGRSKAHLARRLHTCPHTCPHACPRACPRACLHTPCDGVASKGRVVDSHNALCRLYLGIADGMSIARGLGVPVLKMIASESRSF